MAMAQRTILGCVIALVTVGAISANLSGEPPRSIPVAAQTPVSLPDSKGSKPPHETPKVVAPAVSSVSDVTRKSPVEIDPAAVAPYTEDQYPNVVAKFGSAVRDLNATRRKTAKIAAMDMRCDRVQMAQVTSGSNRFNRRFWVSCDNQTRYFFDDDSLAANQPAGVQTLEDMGRDGLLDW